MSEEIKKELGEWGISLITGYGVGVGAFWEAASVFLLGIIGALGGLTAKWMWNVFKNRNKALKDKE